MPSPTSQTLETDIQLSQLLLAVRRGLLPLLAGSAVVGALTYAALSLMAPRYTSEAQLAIVSKSTNPFPDGRQSPPDAVTPRLDKEAVNTHARALQSPELLLRVADELKLRYSPEFNEALGSVDTWTALLRTIGLAGPRAGESEDDRVLGTISRQLEVAAAKESRFIPIRFTSTDAQLSADFANRLADVYRATLVTTPVEETGAVVKVLAPKVEQLRKEVLDAEAEVERYRAQSDQFRSGPQSTPINDQRMATLNDELTKAEAARNEAEARWRTASEMMSMGSAEVAPEVQKSPVIQGLIAQRVRLERQVAEASAALLPAHPRMLQLNADLAGLKRQITAETQKVVQSLGKDYAATRIKVDGISRQIAELKSKVVDHSGDEARLKSLESTAKSKRTELERLQKQLEDNRTVVNIRQVPVEAQVISRARPNTVPTFPRKGPTTALAMAASMILGLALLITRGLISPPAAPDNPVRGKARSSARKGSASTSVEPALAMPTVAGGKGRHTVELPLVVTALADRLASRAGEGTGSRTLVTSEQPAVDVLPEAVQFAETLSRSGRRVVLVVWSLTGRGLPIARTALKKAGFIDLIMGTATFEQVIGRMPGSDVHIIQPGQEPLDPQAVLDPDRLNLVLDALDEAYEQIVVAGGLQDAGALFETIEGRFDAAVVVMETGAGNSPLPEEDGRLLGFEVTDIDIVRCKRGSAAQHNGAAAVRKAGNGYKRAQPAM